MAYNRKYNGGSTESFGLISCTRDPVILRTHFLVVETQPRNIEANASRYVSDQAAIGLPSLTHTHIFDFHFIQFPLFHSWYCTIHKLTTYARLPIFYEKMATIHLLQFRTSGHLCTFAILDSSFIEMRRNGEVPCWKVRLFSPWKLFEIQTSKNSSFTMTESATDSKNWSLHRLQRPSKTCSAISFSRVLYRSLN